MTKKNKNETLPEDLSAEKEFFENGIESEPDFSAIQSFKPKFVRSPLIAIAVIPVITFLIYMLWSDFVYGIRGLVNSKPENIGNISKALNQGKLKENHYVKGKGLVLIQTQLPVPKGKQKYGVAPKQYFLYYILMDTNNKMLVKLVSNSAYLSDKLPTEFTGRLMKLDAVKESSRLRSYYRLNVKDPSVDIQFKREQWTQNPTKKQKQIWQNNFNELKKGSYFFISDENKNFSPRNKFKADVKIYFKDEYILSFSKKYKIIDEIQLKGGLWNIKNCDCGIGGDVILKKVHGILSLPEENITGENIDVLPIQNNGKPLDCSICTKKQNIKPQKPNNKQNQETLKTKQIFKPKAKIVEIPYDAIVYDESGKEIKFNTKNEYLIKGGNLKTKPENLKLNIEFYPYRDISNCYRWLISKGYVFAQTKKTKTLDDDFEIVVKMSNEEAVSLKKNEKVKRVCQPSKTKGLPPQCKIVYPPLKINPRWVFIFSVSMENIKVQGSDFIIRSAKINYPDIYKVNDGKLLLSGGELRRLKMLIPQSHKENYTIPLSYVSKLKFYPPTVIPDDAWIILSNEPPRTWNILWKLPVVLILFLILLANIRVLIRKFALHSH